MFKSTIAEIKYTRILIFERSSSCNQLCHYNVPPKRRPMCSSITQQHYHPWSEHDSTRNKGNTSKLTCSQGYTKLSQANTVGFIRLTRGWNVGCEASELNPRAMDTCTRTSLNSKTSTHTQHKEASPSLLHSPSGYAFPSSAINGV